MERKLEGHLTAIHSVKITGDNNILVSIGKD